MYDWNLCVFENKHNILKTKKEYSNSKQMTDSQNKNLMEHIKHGQGTIETQYKSNIDTAFALIS